MPDQERGHRGGERSDVPRREAGGGFRIRLSDNELRAARTIQDAFQLRSTVAVLGFALRTVAQLLEQGALAELVAQQQQLGGRPPREGNDRGNRGERFERVERVERAPRPDPFARPSKPAIEPVPEVQDEAVVEEVVEDVEQGEGSVAESGEATEL
jgi:hypothetical protein